MPAALSGVPMPRFTATQELFRADGLSISAAGNTVTGTVKNQVNGVTTGIIDVSNVANALLIINVGAVTGTATPTLAVFFDTQDFYGNWVTVSNSTSIGGTAITATGLTSGLVTSTGLAFSGRVRWTVSGTNPVFSGVSLDLFGR